MPATPEFLYFDLGRVLLDFDHARMLRQMAEVAGVDVPQLREALMPGGEPADGDLQWRLEAGRLTDDEYYDTLCERLGTRPPRAELELAASDIFRPIEPMLELVDTLHQSGWRLGLLSNTNAIHWRFFLDGRYPTLSRVFEVQVASFEVRAMKPDPAIYRAAVERAGVPAERVFFTDDRPENVEGARSFGLDAVLFEGLPGLSRELAKRGVLAPAD